MSKTSKISQWTYQWNIEIDYSEIVKAIRDGFDGISKMTVVMDSGDEINLDLAFGR